MQNATLGIGVIGIGNMGADHVKTITTAVSGAEVRVIADIELGRAEMIASRVPGARTLASAEDLIRAPEVDAVIVASNDAAHAEYVVATIAAGKPVLCEKPLAPTVAECENIVRAEQAAGLRLVQVGFMRRFDPGYVELRDKIASGVIGAPLLANCAHRNFRVGNTWPPQATIIRSAVHEIDVMPWVFGREVVAVDWLSPIRPDSGKLPDPQVMILQLEGDALVVAEILMRSNYGYEIRCEVVGEKGTVELAPAARTVVRSDLKASRDVPRDWRDRFAEAYRLELQSWVNAIFRWRSGKTESGPVDGADAWDGYRAAVIADAVLASMARGGRVAVESTPLPELYRRSRAAAASTGGGEPSKA